MKKDSNMVENQSNRHDKCSKTPPTTGWAIWALLIVVVLLGSGASVLTKRRSEECVVAFSDSASGEASIHVNTVEQLTAQPRNATSYPYSSVSYPVAASTTTTAMITSDYDSHPTTTKEMNIHDFENEEWVKRLDSAFTSTSKFTLTTDTIGAAYTTTAATMTSDCGSSLLLAKTEMSVHYFENEEGA
ncbi:hypothetical protein TL16_g10851 [Triparma laevis f. inornata]|uniref:Transmembrane protein n=1 Tax=Triparma laevis f. inornata TaxID=1714386 RepID=A0A9W7ERS1_9STRA|nr:hypothetical protein TL16_g10851 [Triparma laevis f. inornata]